MEEQTLRYYLSLFSFVAILLYFGYIHLSPIIIKEDRLISINKDQKITKIIDLVILNHNYINKKIIYLTFHISNKLYSQINYGKFYLKKGSNILDILKIISTKSNYDYKITIVEGWQTYQSNNYLKKFYKKNFILNYKDLIANTYIINSSNSFNDFNKFLIKNKNKFFKKYKNNLLVKEYGIHKILIISSLIEKEAKNHDDKALIGSVILNRLNLGMKLQIDATVIYALTEGNFKLNRSLTYKDLVFEHPYNTYRIKALPPGMISYVGLKTVEILLENNKSDFLFYFYNIKEKKHIFSKNFKEHKNKLNEYRKKKS